MLDVKDLFRQPDGTVIRDSSSTLLVLRAIMIRPDTQERLARRTDVAPSTVSGIVQKLDDSGLLRTVQGQARSRAVQLKEVRGLAVGVHLGFTTTLVSVRRLDTRTEDAAVQALPTGANRRIERWLPDVVQAIREAAEGIGVSPDHIVAVGMGVPRMVDPRKPRFAEPILPPWRPGDDPAARLAAELRVPVRLDNDANVGALGEYIYGSSAETLVYVKASTGIGAGIVHDHVLIRGSAGLAGEVGHLTLDQHGAVCRCGGRGCLETVIGAQALLDEVRRAYTGEEDTNRPQSVSQLIERAKNGDVVCRRVLQDAGHTLGLALAQLCNLLNPKAIVLGGTLAQGEELVLDPCRATLHRYALAGAVDAERFELRTSTLGQKAEVFGALALGIDGLVPSQIVSE